MRIQEFFNSSLLFQIVLLKKKIDAELLPILQKYNLNFWESLVLISLYFEKNKEVTPTQIVKSLKISKASLSQFLGRLQQDGFLKRRIGAKDARQVFLYLTKDGESIAMDLINHFEWQNKMVENKRTKTKIKALVSELHSILNR